MTGFATFVFLAVVWLPNGDPQPPIARAEATMADCLADAGTFVGQAEAMNAQNPPSMRMSYHVACKAVTNDSEVVDA